MPVPPAQLERMCDSRGAGDPWHRKGWGDLHLQAPTRPRGGGAGTREVGNDKSGGAWERRSPRALEVPCGAGEGWPGVREVGWWGGRRSRPNSLGQTCTWSLGSGQRQGEGRLEVGGPGIAHIRQPGFFGRGCQAVKRHGGICVGKGGTAMERDSTGAGEAQGVLTRARPGVGRWGECEPLRGCWGPVHWLSGALCAHARGRGRDGRVSGQLGLAVAVVRPHSWRTGGTEGC